VLIVPSLLGGIIGAVLLRMTPSHLFDRLVPLLILFATFLFMLQEPVQRMIRLGAVEGHAGAKGWVLGAIVFQLFVAVYGGYFGAGIARKIGPKGVRRNVVIVGFGMALSLLLRR
jgi:uncharacterized membrane protein YfcA